VEAFEELVRNSKLVVDEGAWGWKGELSGNGTPLLLEFAKHWKDALGDQVGAQELLQAIPTLVDANPLDVQAISKDGVTYISDVKGFKASLKISEEARPLVEWGDLPVARF
jgi:insulysin